MAKALDPLFTFFAVIGTPKTELLSLRRVRLSADVQRELSAKFSAMLPEWSDGQLRRVKYSPTFHTNLHQVIRVGDFEIPEMYARAAVAAQGFPPLTFPLPAGEQLRALVAVDANKDAAKSRFFFQACDQRQVLGRRFVLFEDNGTFRRLDQRGLAIRDHLAAIIEGSELLFRSYFTAKKFLPLTHLYRDATDAQIETLFQHAKIKLPDGVLIAQLVESITPTARKKVAIILDERILENEKVTPDKIKSYAKKYMGLELVLRTTGGRRIEVPSDSKLLYKFLRCLDEEFYTSELTERPCETNSYRQLEEHDA